MLRLQHLSGTFADDDAGGHRVAGCHARQNRSVRDTKVVYSIDLEVTVDDGHRIASHFGGTCLMGVSRGGIADEIFQIGPFQISRHNFTFCIGSKRSRITDLAAQFHANYRGPHIIGVRQEVVMNLNWVERIRSCQADLPPAFWLYDTCQ